MVIVFGSIMGGTAHTVGFVGGVVVEAGGVVVVVGSGPHGAALMPLRLAARKRVEINETNILVE